ncbi:hypothetical protein KPH14_007210 [Odynerus spinipes]|uniref:Calponin-homology (CH) domain-containing protein n=1 Tax=Odynerus spinipes TaxID=1348599 RepID=A0AAD9R9Z9_9HYME|nr:hypothetical protein KPH14_007210 [Odynerus spinipes]
MVDVTDQYDNTKDQSDHSKELCAWIESIPFPKAKKYLSPLSFYRDLSDAVLLAEILKLYYPRYVDLHNYISASNLLLKKENWNTLNRKVLSKIDVKITKEVINQLANGNPGAIDKLLFEIKYKIERINQPDNASCSESKNDEQGKNDDVNSENTISGESSKNSTCKPTEVNEQCTPRLLKISGIKGAIFNAAKWLLGWFFFWSLFLNYRNRNNLTEDKKTEAEAEDETVPRQLCLQLRQELREKDNVICTLNHKIAYLEGAMKLKDLRISGLTSQIVQNAVEMDNFTKSQANDHTSKTRVRSAQNQKRNENETGIML